MTEALRRAGRLGGSTRIVGATEMSSRTTILSATAACHAAFVDRAGDRLSTEVESSGAVFAAIDDLDCRQMLA